MWRWLRTNHVISIPCLPQVHPEAVTVRECLARRKEARVTARLRSLAART